MRVMRRNMSAAPSSARRRRVMMKAAEMVIIELPVAISFGQRALREAPLATAFLAYLAEAHCSAK